MTRIIDLSEVIYVGGVDDAIYCSKDIFMKDDLLVAQSDSQEDWFDIVSATSALPLKPNYTMYILTKHIK